jgi:hypothetical protein
MAIRINRSPFHLSVDFEQIDVTVGHPTYSESWRAVDSNGHEHYYARGFPTLREVIDEQHWCDGTEGYALHEPHLVVDAVHFECLICDEVVSPGMDPAFTPKSIAGSRSGRLNGPRSDGLYVTAVLTEQEIDEMAADPSDETMLRVLDAVPIERLVSIRQI